VSKTAKEKTDVREFVANGGSLQKAMTTGKRIKGDNMAIHQEAESQPMIPKGRNLIEVAARKIDPANNLLGDRWIAKGLRAALVVGSTGIGKSSTGYQAAMSFACGREAFGLTPNGKLRVLIIQAENDADDETEMTSGIESYLNLEDWERQDVATNTEVVTLRGLTGAALIDALEIKFRESPFDLLIIDPLDVYLPGGDPTNVEEVAKFFDGFTETRYLGKEPTEVWRKGLNSLTQELKMGALVFAHTPKTTNRDTSTWNEDDWAYASAGAAKLNNSTSASLIISPTDTAGVYEFRAAKRRKRIGWRDHEGNKVHVRFYAHGTTSIHWEPVSGQEVQKRREDAAQDRNETNLEAIAERIQDSGGAIGRQELLDNLPAGLTVKAAKAAIAVGKTHGRIVEQTAKEMGITGHGGANKVFVALVASTDSEGEEQ
jgi:hypothetical protein